MHDHKDFHDPKILDVATESNPVYLGLWPTLRACPTLHISGYGVVKTGPSKNAVASRPAIVASFVLHREYMRPDSVTTV